MPGLQESRELRELRGAVVNLCVSGGEKVAPKVVGDVTTRLMLES